MELNLVREDSDNEGFYKCVSIKRKTKENVGSQIMDDTEKMKTLQDLGPSLGQGGAD